MKLREGSLAALLLRLQAPAPALMGVRCKSLSELVPSARPAAQLPSASAVKRSIGSTTGCTITEKAPTRAFSWLKAPTSAFTFKTLLRHYAKRALTPW